MALSARAQKYIRRITRTAHKAVAAEIETARLLTQGVKQFGEEFCRQSVGADFDRLMGLAVRLEELGEEKLKLVLYREKIAAMLKESGEERAKLWPFREQIAEMGFDPNQN
jgi:hypothetical protein